MGMQEKFDEDDVILKEKAEGRYMYMVLEGSVALYMNYRQRDEYLLGVCNKGNVFGEMGLLCHDENMYTAVAFTKVTVAKFSEFELGAFIRGYPDQALGIMRNIARMNKILNVNLKMVMSDNQRLDISRSFYSELLTDSSDSISESDGDSGAKWHS